MPKNVHVAGFVLTPNRLNDDNRLVAVKTNTQSISGTASFQNDDSLWVLLDGFAVYSVQLNMGATTSVDAATSIDLNTRWTIPSGATVQRRGTLGPATGMTSVASTNVRSNGTSWTGTTAYGADDTPNAIVEFGLIRTVEPGILRVQWSQNISNAATLSVGPNSFLIAEKIA